jgi:glycosyltransferase involved in cell wall biosynthesis
LRPDSITVIIPTYLRGGVVLESVRALLSLGDTADELILVDQTPVHPAEIEKELRELHEAGRLRWIRLSAPSIPHAMNIGLTEARSNIALFLDDDIVPDKRLIEMHRAAQRSSKLVAGMVLQPGQVPERLGPGGAFRFNSNAPASISEFMGGNFSVQRATAVSLGGFDENFVGAAYRFEAEFAHRYVAAFGQILYEPRAVIHHLQIGNGGTRAHGHHLRTVRPSHSVGAYYELLRTRRTGWLQQMVKRPFRSVRTRYHLRRPWWIPLTLMAELRGFFLAINLHRSGPKLLKVSQSRSDD